MEISTLFGLPAHPLVIHLVVLSIPVLALLALAFALRSSWRPALAVPLLALTAVTVIGTVLATGSGEALSERVDETSLLETHEELGEQTETLVILFGLGILLMVGLDWYLHRRPRRSADTTPPPLLRQGLVATMVAVLLLGAAATVWDVRAGHAGAKAVWSDTPASDESTNGSGGEEEDDEASFVLLPGP